MLHEVMKFTDAGLLGVLLIVLFMKWQDMKMDHKEKMVRAQADIEQAKAMTRLSTIIEERMPQRNRAA